MEKGEEAERMLTPEEITRIKNYLADREALMRELVVFPARVIAKLDSIVGTLLAENAQLKERVAELEAELNGTNPDKTALNLIEWATALLCHDTMNSGHDEDICPCDACTFLRHAGIFHGDRNYALKCQSLGERIKELESAAREHGAETLGLRKRIHFLGRHNQLFERCESPWCHPDSKNNPALDWANNELPPGEIKPAKTVLGGEEE